MKKGVFDVKTEPARIYVIAGKETPLVNYKCKQLVDSLLAPQQKSTGLFVAESADIPAADILDELRTIPFLTNRRVVVVRDSEVFISRNREILEKYFDNPSVTGVLILTVKTWDGRTRLAGKLSGFGRLINVSNPPRERIPGRIIEYASSAHGKILAGPAAELLVELAGDSLPALFSEIDKLSLYVGDKRSITAENVDVLTGRNRLFNVFNVIDAVTDGDTSRAVGRLRKMFAEDRSSEYTFVGAFAYYVRKMFTAKVMLADSESIGSIAGRLRIWSGRDEFFRRLRRISLGQIGSILQYLSEMDYEIKTGRAKPQVSAERFVFRFAGV